jgi:hypothetical protein
MPCEGRVESQDFTVDRDRFPVSYPDAHFDFVFSGEVLSML